MDRVVFLYLFLASMTILLARNGVEGKNDPKIFTKDGSVHIRSGDNGNIVFEHPGPAGKVIVAGQELNVRNSTGPKGQKGERGSPGTNGTLAVKGQTGDKGEPGTKGDKGEQGDRGLPGINGTLGTSGTKGDPGRPGPVGPAGRNGSDGDPGQKGDRGDVGAVGSPGANGTTGLPGPIGLPGAVGDKGANGTQGLPGVKGEKGDRGYTTYLIKNESIQCDSSNYGILRYFTTQLQLCTPRGWRYLSFQPTDGCSDVPDIANMPQANYQAYRNADLGIMFQFNRNSVPSVVSKANLNITAEISPANSTLLYEEAVMRQAVLLTGGTRRIKISGIPDDFWRNSNWSVMALLKFKDIDQQFVRVLGHGTTTGGQGLHLGITKTLKGREVIHGYYSNDFIFGKVEENTWHHITWTSRKRQGTEHRCIYINNKEHSCEINSKGQYQGSGATTLGAWWDEKLNDNFLLDNLIIASGIVQYSTETAAKKQECFAKTLDDKLP